MTYQLMYFPDFKESAVTLSYDDGVTADRRLIEIMAKYGLKGTFNLNTAMPEDKIRIPQSEYKSLYLDSGNEIALHGARHLTLTAVSKEQMIDEIYSNRKRLEELTGQIITGMAYANGSYNDEVVEALKACGVDYSRTTVESNCTFIDDDFLRLKPTCHHDSPRLMEFAESIITEQKRGYFWAWQPRLLYVWGHAYEFDNNDNWSVIESFAQRVGNNPDIWYATNGEIYRYVKAYQGLRYGTNGLVYNPSAIDVYIRTPNDKKVIIPAGQTVCTL